MTSHAKKGFTLIELLVVIAIIAILAVAVILTLNPAELLRQARDTTRINDLNTMKSAIGLYITDQSGVSGFSLGTSGTCFEATSVASSSCGFFPSKTAVVTSISRAVNGNGWIPVNFSAITAGAPIGALPLDPSYSPTQNAFFYAYISSSTTNTFKLATTLESQKYSNGGTNDAESTDGGTSASAYETGTALSL